MSTIPDLLEGVAGFAGFAGSPARNTQTPSSRLQEAESQTVQGVGDVFTREKKEKEVQIVLRGDSAKAAKVAKPPTVEHPLLPPGEPVKGLCRKCGAPVTWRGPLEGLISQLGPAVHLICPEGDTGCGMV